MAAIHPLRINAGGAGDGPHDALDLGGDAFQFTQIGAEDLDAHRRADACRQHVDSGLDGHGPYIADTGQGERLIHLGDQPVERHAVGPIAFRLQIDQSFSHLGRRRIGRGRGAAGLAID